jgi:hypothetical protein
MPICCAARGPVSWRSSTRPAPAASADRSMVRGLRVTPARPVAPLLCVPHTCQNERTPAVAQGCWGAERMAHELKRSGLYRGQKRPDKEEVDGSSPSRPTQVTALAPSSGPRAGPTVRRASGFLKRQRLWAWTGWLSRQRKSGSTPALVRQTWRPASWGIAGSCRRIRWRAAVVTAAVRAPGCGEAEAGRH